MILRISLALILLSLSSCGQAGWIGYYSIRKSDGSENKIADNTDNGIVAELPKGKEMWITMPRDCSGFTFAGIITPFTPPIPIPNFRSLTFKSFMGNENPCHYFIAETRPQAKVQLKTIDSETNETKIYDPRELEGRWDYTKYIFPIRAKNIDSGILIIEKDGEKIEVPFEYKYFKFWY